jgi:ABC-type branched-subunit amino acid transport system substrate-binding protein
MKHWKKAIVSLLVLALLALPLLGLLGCGSSNQTGTVTIKVGYLTDLTGPASSAMQVNQWAILDAWQYLEKNDPIPGVKLKLESYDTQMDPARAIPGYEWLKERGVVVLYAYMPQTLDVVIPYLERDKMPAFTHNPSDAGLASPWVFDSGPTSRDTFTLALQWLSDHWSNYPTKPTIGIVGWDTPYELTIVAAMKDYVQSHPDEFDLVGSYLSPSGAMSWSGYVEKLKNCDYVCPCAAAGTGIVSFISQFRSAGGTATFFGGEPMPVWTNLIIPTVGWSAMDGSFSALPWPWWSDQIESVAVAKDALLENHSGETELSLGFAYVSQVTAQFFWYELLKAAIEEVGAGNVDGQAVYNTAINFHYTIQGMPEMSYSQTNRVNSHYAKVYEWSAQAKDLVAISDWLPAP